MAIPVSFHRGTSDYAGVLTRVSGAGSAHVYHLYIDRYYYGRLRESPTGWVFDNNWGWDDLAEKLASFVLDWEEKATSD